MGEFILVYSFLSVWVRYGGGIDKFSIGELGKLIIVNLRLVLCI